MVSNNSCISVQMLNTNILFSKVGNTSSAQCVHWTVGFPCSKKSPVVATGSKKSPVVATGECRYYRGITIATGE